MSDAKKPSCWIEVCAETYKSNVPLLEELLSAEGALSVSLVDAADQAILEPAVATTPLWDHAIVKALFSCTACGDSAEAVREAEGILSAVRLATASFSELQGIAFSFSLIEDQDWERSALDQFHAFDIGDMLRVVPSWQDHERQSSRINLLMDPGLAFGTGTHATTHLCLEHLDRLVTTDKSVVDFGCGSGILGIAALKLDAGRVCFIDNDPQAITATHNNLRLNKLENKDFSLINSAEQGVQSMLAGDNDGADIVVANILAGTLIELQGLIAALTRTRGLIVLSGILDEQADSVIDAFRESFESFERQDRDGWTCIQARRK